MLDLLLNHILRTFLSVKMILCIFNLLQDVLSMLDQPANFNSDDFEIPIYPQFND